MAKIITDKNKIEEVLRRGAAEVIVKENLRQRLASGKKLRIKLGIDPTGSVLHLGHGVVLRKLKDFQNLVQDLKILPCFFKPVKILHSSMSYLTPRSAKYV